MSFWDRLKENAKDIDAWRKLHLAFAEWVDAWRIVPRAIVVAYAYMMYDMGKWYTSLKPYMIEGCNAAVLKEACIAQAPTTQHMALVTAAVGIAAAIFGLYTASGKKWNGFTHWNKPKEEPKPEEEK